MASARRKHPVLSGEGDLAVGRWSCPVVYEVASSDLLKTGKGWVSGGGDEMRRAFSAGEAELTLADGQVLRLILVAHAAGGDTVYFEIRGQPRR